MICEEPQVKETISVHPTVAMDERIIVSALEYFTTPQLVEALESELLECGSVDVPVKHMFCDGIYSRQITMPKGMIAIGHAHSKECLNVVVSGSVSVVIDGKARRINAPHSFISPAGNRKIGYVHEDLTWITIHSTDKLDINEIESEVLVKSDAYKKFETKNQLKYAINPASVKVEFMDDVVDFFKALSELGFTPDQVKTISENTSDLVPFDGESGNSVYVGTSERSGNGMFASFSICADSAIVTARKGKNRTPAGRYVNHSKRPNCKFNVELNGDISLVSLFDIPQHSELTVDYRQAFAAAREADNIQIKLNH